MRRYLVPTLCFAAVLAGTSHAQQRVLPRTQDEVRLSFAPIVKAVAPAVVNVYVRRRVETQISPLLDDPWFRQFLGRGGDIPRERIENSLGSGVIVSPEGLIVTNNHVIKGRGEAEIKIALADRREFTAKLILADKETDLAVLKLDAPAGEVFPALEFDDSDAIEVGDIVLAIGNPFGVGQTVTSGIVSALARTRVGISDYQFFIQTDAAINPGNSGGALVDVNGRLIGLNTAIYSRTGGSHGIGFATPSNMVRLVVQSALQGTRVQRPWLGAKLQPVTSEIARSLRLDRPVGALIKEVVRTGPAARAGLRPADVIVRVDDKDVADPRAFLYHFSTKGIGGDAKLVIVREGTLREAVIALEAAPEDPPREDRELSGGHPLTGARIANLSPALATELELDDESFGVVVLELKQGSPASRFARKGDIIVRLNDAAVQNVSQLVELIRRPTRAWRLVVKRENKLLSFVVGG